MTMAARSDIAKFLKNLAWKDKYCVTAIKKLVRLLGGGSAPILVPCSFKVNAMGGTIELYSAKLTRAHCALIKSAAPNKNRMDHLLRRLLKQSSAVANDAAFDLVTAINGPKSALPQVLYPKKQGPGGGTVTPTGACKFTNDLGNADCVDGTSKPDCENSGTYTNGAYQGDNTSCKPHPPH
jgi:hypothetical protein